MEPVASFVVVLYGVSSQGMACSCCRPETWLLLPGMMHGDGCPAPRPPSLSPHPPLVALCACDIRWLFVPVYVCTLVCCCRVTRQARQQQAGRQQRMKT